MSSTRSEHWRDIPDWPGYQASTHGRIRSVDRQIEDNIGRTRTYRGRIKSTYKDQFGYAKVTLARTGEDDGCRLHVHVLVASAFIGPRPDGQQVCHCDGDRTNNKPDNLRYDTVAGNHADKRKHGTLRFGETAPTAKLTDRQVNEIKTLRGWFKGKDLAAWYGTSKAHVCNIQKGNRRSVGA